MTAFSYFDKKMIAILINKKSDINKLSSLGYSSFMYIFIVLNDKEEFEAVRYLCKNGADINLPSFFKETPIMLAINKKNANINTIKILIENGADLSVKNLFDETPLMIELNKERLNYEIIQLLLENGADINETIKGRSIISTLLLNENKNIELIKYLIENGANVNALDLEEKNALTYELNSSIPNQEIIELLIESGIETKNKVINIMHAVKLNSLELFKKVIPDEIDFNMIGDNGESLLMKACTEGNLDIISYLIENGADANFKTKENIRMLMSVCSSGNEEVFNIFNTSKIDINSKSFDERNFLMYACAGGNINIVKYFLEKGIDINFKTSNNKTVLTEALSSEKINLELIKYLIRQGADINFEDEDKNNLLFYAVNNKNINIEILNFLLNNGFMKNINKINNKGENILMSALVNKKLKIDLLKFLVDKNLDICIKNKERICPLQYSINDIENFKFLISKKAHENSFLTLEDKFGLINSDFIDLEKAKMVLEVILKEVIVEKIVQLGYKKTSKYIKTLRHLDMNLNVTKGKIDAYKYIISNIFVDY